MAIALRAIGTAVPKHRFNQSEMAALLQADGNSDRGIAALFRMAGIDERYSPLSYRELQAAASAEERLTISIRMQWYEHFSGDLALAACRDAMERAAIEPDEVTHVVVATCTGFSAPGIDALLVEQLNLSAHVARTNVSFHGCHGAFNALRVANAFCAADPTAVVMTVCVELCSLHAQPPTNTEHIVADSLFADGAACIVLGASQAASDQTLQFSSTLFPEGRELMSWSIRDSGFLMSLSPLLPEFISQSLAPSIDAFLQRCGRKRCEIGSFAPHPGGPRILTAIQKALELAPDALRESRYILKHYGNMSSVTVPFILQRMLERKAPFPILCIGLGPGISLELLLISSASSEHG